MKLMRREVEGMTAHLERLLADTDQEFVLSLIALFRTHGEEIHAEIVHAAENGDMKTLERSVHSLKGAAGNIGAAELRACCQKVEHAAHRGELNPDDVRRVGDLLHGTSNALQEISTRFSSEGGV